MIYEIPIQSAEMSRVSNSFDEPKASWSAVSINVDALVEDGMVAPGQLSFQGGERALFPENHCSTKAGSADHVPYHFAPGYQKMAENGKVLKIRVEEVNGDNHFMITDPKTEVEGFIMREHDIDVIQEPVGETDAFVKRGACENEQLLRQSDPSGLVNGIESFLPGKRRVQWNDNHGKDLVEVHEYEASDTGDSDEDDVDADAHACTCSIQ